MAQNEKTAEVTLRQLGITEEALVQKLLHPVGRVLAEAIKVSPDGEQLFLSDAVVAAIDTKLRELTARGGLEFFEAMRQTTNIAAELRERFPESEVPAALLHMLEGVAAAALPVLEARDTHSAVEKVSGLHEAYARMKKHLSDTREQLPDDGSRLDRKNINLPIKG